MCEWFDMKQMTSVLFLLVMLVACSSQQDAYNESADASAAIKQGLIAAKAANKPMLLIFGANWCPDCQALSKALKEGGNAKKIAAEFQVVKVDVGNFDTNLDITALYGDPIQGGIPGAVILTPENKIIYMFKPGEIATMRSKGGDALYRFLKNKV